MSLWKQHPYDVAKAAAGVIGLRSMVEQDHWRQGTNCIWCGHYDGNFEPSEFIAWDYRDNTDEYEGMALCGRHAMDVRNYLEQKHRE